MSAEFTRGPWTARKYGVIVAGPAIEYINGSAQAQIAMVCVRVEAESAELERDANAALISAAPDMYAVLKEVAECSQYWSDYDVPLGIHDRIVAALAKAGGQ